MTQGETEQEPTIIYVTTSHKITAMSLLIYQDFEVYAIWLEINGLSYEALQLKEVLKIFLQLQEDLLPSKKYKLTNFSYQLRSFLDNHTYIKYFSSLLISRQLKEHCLLYIGRFL